MGRRSTWGEAARVASLATRRAGRDERDGHNAPLILRLRKAGLSWRAVERELNIGNGNGLQAARIAKRNGIE